MLTIQDRQLKSVYARLQSQRASDPSVVVDDSAVIDILAAVGDGRRSGKAIKADLLAAGSKPAQLAIAQAGMTAKEKKDVETILDRGDVPMSPAAKNFLEALVGRAALDGGTAALQIIGDQSQGLRGISKPNAIIEAINLSKAPSGRYHNDEAVEVGKADGSGSFKAKFDDRLGTTSEGDVLRVRARYADGKTSSWVDVRVKGLAAKDSDNAVVSLQRIELSYDAALGKIVGVNNNVTRPISEPGAKLQFTNARTGDKTVITLNQDGELPGNGTIHLAGKPGDELIVAASDGVNNKSFTREAGRLKVPGQGGGSGDGVDLPDPKLVKKHLKPDGTPIYQVKRYNGPWEVKPDFATSLRQGAIGNCYFPAAISAIADCDHKDIARIGKKNPDGTFEITFKARSYSSPTGFKDVKVKVDGDIYVRPYGTPIYGTQGQGLGTFCILEKAYASWKGSYDAIGQGGYAQQVMEEILGRSGYSVFISESRVNQVWDEIQRAVRDNRPACLGTHGSDDSGRYTGTGVYADHAYSLFDCRVDASGKRWVKLRNPWGESEPAGNGPNDGIFELTVEQVCKLYVTFMSVR